MIAALVEALLVGAIQREMTTRKIYGRPAHLVLFDDAKVYRAAKAIGLAHEHNRPPFPAAPVWSWERLS